MLSNKPVNTDDLDLLVIPNRNFLPQSATNNSLKIR